jgi:hypothetical protein
VLVAQAKVKAVYKLYDMVRETSQKHFYAGTLSPGGSGFPTSNGKSLEVGPEPDNGVFSGNLGEPGDPDNEWGGYIAFPTVGGPQGFNKAKNTLMKTKSLGNGGELGAAFHVHFNLDHDANGHIIDQTEIGSAKVGPDDEVENYPDLVGNGESLRPWAQGGPYNPAMSTPGTPIRIARSFRLTKSAGGTMAAPGLPAYPPSDLRIDGAYVERHSAPAYFIQKGGAAIWDFARDRQQGLVSFWWKPSYFPELTGKVRMMFDMSRYHSPCGQDVYVWPFAMWFYPVNYNPAFAEETAPLYSHNNMGKFNPVSVVWGTKTWHDTSEAHEFGNLSGCLNHEGHMNLPCFGDANKPSILKAHRWIHTALKWHLQGNTDSGYLYSEMHLNGLYVNTPPIWHKDRWRSYAYTEVTTHAQRRNKMPEFAQHSGGSKNQIRFGGTSEIGSSPKAMARQSAYRGNYSGDHTIDEIYVWADANVNPSTIWMRGRYAGPDGQYGEGRFDSQELGLDKSLNERRLAAPSLAAPPGGGGGASASMTAEPRRIRILGMCWTWYGESLNTFEREQYAMQGRGYTGEKILAGWGSMYPKRTYNPTVRVSIIDGQTTHGPYSNEFYSPVILNDGSIPFIQDPKSVKYRVEMSSGSGFGEILLATPVFDDITLFIDDNQSHLLSYVFDNRSF